MASKAGPIIGLIGAILLILIAGFIVILGGDITVTIFTLLWGILGIAGASLGFKGNKGASAYLLIAGIGGLIVFFYI